MNPNFKSECGGTFPLAAMVNCSLEIVGKIGLFAVSVVYSRRNATVTFSLLQCANIYRFLLSSNIIEYLSPPLPIAIHIISFITYRNSNELYIYEILIRVSYLSFSY